MKRFYLCITLQLCIIHLWAQKPPLDTTALNHWPTVKNGVISNNGEIVLYTIQALGSPEILIIHSVKDNQEQQFPNASNGFFSDDSRKVIFVKGKDSLAILTIGSLQPQYITVVQSFRLEKINGIEYLIYLIQQKDAQLVYHNLQTGDQHVIHNVKDYSISANGSTLVYTTTRPGYKDSAAMELYWIKPGNWKALCIAGNLHVRSLTLDRAGKQLAFIKEEEINKKIISTVCYYKEGMNKIMPLTDDNAQEIDSNLQIGEIAEFCKSDPCLFFTLKDKSLPIKKPGEVMVDVWSYTDPKLQSQQLNEIGIRNFVAIIHLNNRHIVRLQQEDESIAWKTDKVVCVSHIKGDENESHWNRLAQNTAYLINTFNGQKEKLRDNTNLFFFMPSPKGLYTVGLEYYRWGKDFYSYDLKENKARNLTACLPVLEYNFMNSEDDCPYFSESRGLAFAAWLANAKGLLIYDEFDIWLLDPSSKNLPVNLTNGYGRQHNIEFRLAEPEYQNRTIPNKGLLIISAFNRADKTTGFFSINMDKKEDPKMLTMGPYTYELSNSSNEQNLGNARNANKFLIKRSSTDQSPNYFLTKDFREFKSISRLYPEKKYNWITSELVSFQTLDNYQEQGVLYKPENFDPRKKYPLLIHFYERKSRELHAYHIPALSPGDLDIPWFVSHGYVVFTPDIRYVIGNPGESAYNSVVSSTDQLADSSWVDVKKMGIQGHSFGGFETNYIITRTNKFAAAVSSAGFTNLISFYGGLLDQTISAQYFMEVWQLRMGATMWEKQDLYIKNSPVFQADKIKSPLLIISNKNDIRVPFSQGLELFNALRRLGKRVWMLQYDDGVHGVRGKAYIDYLLRMTQFFDHYLKNASPAKWMTRGIPARLKGIDNGFDLDLEIATPGPGLLLNSKTPLSAK